MTDIEAQAQAGHAPDQAEIDAGADEAASAEPIGRRPGDSAGPGPGAGTDPGGLPVSMAVAGEELAAVADEGPAVTEPSAAAPATTAVAAEAGSGSPEALGVDYQSALLSDLARAMHEAADTRHTRAIEVVGESSSVSIDEVRARGVSDAETARDHADRDVAEIEAWATAQVERIGVERERRIEARQRELDALLSRLDAQIEWEVGAIEAEVARHVAALDAFFTRLRSESDPAVIARLATEAPRLGDLAQIAADARAREDAVSSAEEPGPAHPGVALPSLDSIPVWAAASSGSPVEDETSLVGVMDPASTADAVGAGLAGDAPGPIEYESPGLVGPDPLPEASQAAWDPGATRAPSGWGTGADAPSEQAREDQGSSGSLLQAIPALRPVAAWLNHGSDTNDREG